MSLRYACSVKYILIMNLLEEKDNYIGCFRIDYIPKWVIDFILVLLMSPNSQKNLDLIDSIKNHRIGQNQVPVTNKRDLYELLPALYICIYIYFDILKTKRILNVICRKFDIDMTGQDLEKDAIQPSIKDLQSKFLNI